MSKSSKNSFLMQGMILAAASIVCRVIGLLYRSPLDRRSTRLNSSHLNESRMPSSA